MRLNEYRLTNVILSEAKNPWPVLFFGVKYGIFAVVSSWHHRLLKVFLWSLAGLGIAVLAAIQVALSPKFLTRTAGKYAAEYVDGDVRFESIRASVFRSFPNLNVTADGFQ